jgi:hypothetical protein
MKRPGRNLDGVIVRRLLLLIAVLVGLTAVAGSIAPGPASLQPTATAPPPQPSEATSRPARVLPRTVHAALSAAPDRPARRISARLGDHVSITVRDENIDTVALGDVDIEPVERALPARFDLMADDAGTYPLVLVDAGRRIGTLVVR